MRAMVVGAVIAALCFGCDRKGNPLMESAGSAAPTIAAGPGVPTKPASGSGSAAAGSAAATTQSPLAAAVAAALPRAADVLPADLVGDKEALLVTGDNWRFQIPKHFKPVDHPSKAAYTGTIDGMATDAPMTLWAMSEPFTGDLAALAERERKDIEAKGGTKTLDAAVLLDVGGTIANTHAHRIVGKLTDKIDMRILAVHGGRAYIYHCETPNVPNAWINVGSDCMVRGTTFNVAPPSGPGSNKSGAPAVAAAGSAEAPGAPLVPPGDAPSSPPTDAPHVLAVGDKVSAQWTNGRWYPGKIGAVNANGTYDIHFNDGDKRKGVSAAQVKYIAPPPPPKTDWKVGDRVQGKWTNGSWYNGKVTAVNPDGTFKVAYDDGDVSNALPPAKVRAIPTRTTTSSSSSSSSSSNAPCPGPGLTRRCNGQCVNIQTNNNHCGGCNNRCPSGKSCDGHMFCRDAAGNL